MNRRFVLAASVAGVITLLWGTVARSWRSNPKPRLYPEPPAPPSPEAREWLLLGLERIHPSSSSRVDADPSFTETPEAGPDHDMSRELPWREFPIDQRGTCAGQFWDPRGR
jgi:hypothetical protein